MDPQRWRQVGEVFEAALSLGDEERKRMLVDLGDSDMSLVMKVQELLDADENAGSFLEGVAFGEAEGASELEEPPVAFGADGRYRVVRLLGAGGMGVVYEVEDQLNGNRLALKTVSDRDAERLYRLKREFRVQSGIVHPNILRLHELEVWDSRCFFTMELVQGVDIVTYCTDMIGAGPSAAGPDRDGPLPAVSRQGGMVEQCVGQVLLQLVEGLVALHSRGIVHRDVKPSNVLVSNDGRVVLLDFGIVAEMAEQCGEESDENLVGTAAYMSPEQICCPSSINPSQDWYAVGVLLHRVLFGKLPERDVFSIPGRPLSAGAATSTAIGAAASSVIGEPLAGISSGGRLERLCQSLLEPDPSKRAGAFEILRQLGVADGHRGRTAMPHLRGSAPSICGRERELQALIEIFESSRSRSEAAFVLCSGPSGVGKTALAKELVGRLRRRHSDLVVLRAGCNPQEHIPCAAVDSLVDQLAASWRQLPSQEAQAVIPDDFHSLLSAFAVLARVGAVTEALSDRVSSESRRDGIEVLRDALERLARLRPLLLVIDDAQWVDDETLHAMLRLFPASPVTVLALAKNDAVEHDSVQPPWQDRCYKIVRERFRELFRQTLALELEPLHQASAVALARRLVGGRRGLAERIAAETEGNPRLIIELAEHARARRSLRGERLIEGWLRARLMKLPRSSRTLLVTLCESRRPVPIERLEQCLGVSQAALEREIRTLEREHLVLRPDRDSVGLIGPHQQRARRAVASMLTPEGTLRAASRKLQRPSRDLRVDPALRGIRRTVSRSCRRAEKHQPPLLVEPIYGLQARAPEAVSRRQLNETDAGMTWDRSSRGTVVPPWQWVVGSSFLCR